MGYGRTYGRRPVQRTGPRPNTHAGTCSKCAETVRPGEGILTGSKATGYEVRHGPARWHGSPVSGRYIGGCPKDTDKLNAEGGWS